MKNQILFSDTLTMSEKISVSATTLVIGMLTVFAVLTLIMFVLMIIGKFFEKNSKSSEKKEAVESTPVVVSQPSPVASAPIATGTDDTAVIAAISAAISVYTEQPIGSFRVVSYRKTSTKTAWNKK